MGQSEQPGFRDRVVVAVGLLFSCLMLAGGSGQSAAADQDAPQIRIVSPPRNRVAAGSTLFAVEVAPASGRGIDRVRLVVDGKELAVLSHPPFQAVFDAGTLLAAHTLRAEAVDDLGHTAVAFSSTLYVSYMEDVEVEAQAVPKRAILVGVVDKHGEPLTDLTPGEFALRVEGKPEPLLEAKLDVRPLAVELLLDASGSTLPYWPLIKQGAERFVHQLDKADGSEVSIFAGSTLRVAPFSHQHVATREAILGVYPDMRNGELSLQFGGVINTKFNPVGSRLYEGLAQSVEAINVQEGQRSISVLTDGLDTGGRLNREQVFDVIRRANIRVDAIRYGRITPMVWKTAKPLVKLMEKLAKETGGRQWRVKDSVGIVSTFKLLARQLKGRYRLVFAADPRKHKKDRFRKIKIKVSRRKVRVLAPAGFYDAGG